MQRHDTLRTEILGDIRLLLRLNTWSIQRTSTSASLWHTELGRVWAKKHIPSCKVTNSKVAPGRDEALVPASRSFEVRRFRASNVSVETFSVDQFLFQFTRAQSSDVYSAPLPESWDANCSGTDGSQSSKFSGPDDPFFASLASEKSRRSVISTIGIRNSQEFLDPVTYLAEFYFHWQFQVNEIMHRHNTTKRLLNEEKWHSAYRVSLCQQIAPPRVHLVNSQRISNQRIKPATTFACGSVVLWPCNAVP